MICASCSIIGPCGGLGGVGGLGGLAGGAGGLGTAQLAANIIMAAAALFIHTVFISLKYLIP
ncbi:hypothetical protein EG028_13895 [Chitinophaga barathri]|uniref:Uncharacterized protein n=1 Tax=Chitinophaga barathri TaxID=1647451 RepID=A0A3N4MFF2_9BACT|nr:hypothetical protein EG028_13895 [Chitinophaga barathri]